MFGTSREEEPGGPRGRTRRSRLGCIEIYDPHPGETANESSLARPCEVVLPSSWPAWQPERRGVLAEIVAQIRQREPTLPMKAIAQILSMSHQRVSRIVCS